MRLGYNSLLQLTRQTVPGVFDMEYVFPTGQNNGQISSSIDHISGQQVNYTYDPLKRLTAAATVGPQWGQAYTYDGFGNLTSSTVTQGSGVNWANASDPATNRMNFGYNAYDANGNWDRGVPPSSHYDVENRLVSGQVNHSGCVDGAASWSYDPAGKRVLAHDACISSSNTYLSFYDIFGKRVATYACVSGDACYSATTDVYFGNKLIVSNGVTVITDRLGTVRANSSGEPFEFLPYGEELTATADSRVKFGTYFRDSTGTTTSQDYAGQRYYNFWYGRFNSPDPTTGEKTADPASWNKYAYAGDDPVNELDPNGTDYFNPGDCVSWEWNAGTGNPCGQASNLSYCGPFLSGGFLPGPADPLAGATCLSSAVPLVLPAQGADAQCVLLAAAYASDGGIWNQTCGNPPAAPVLTVGGPADCAAALEELASATLNVLGRVGDIIRYGRNPDPGHRKALSQAVNRLNNALAKVRNSCASVAGAAAAIAAAEAALEAAAPYLAIMGAAL